MEYRLRALLLTVFLASVSQLAYAHKVNVFAYAEDGKVFVEGYFVDGKKAQNSQVKVFDSNGEVIAEGITNDEGQYNFEVGKRSDIKIELNAGMGHMNTFSIAADELGSLPGSIKEAAVHRESQEEVHDQSAGLTPENEEVNLQNDSEADQLNAAPDEIETVVRRAVNEAIKPLVRELDESQQKASLTGIVGGVGYIVGFLGLFAFFKARQEQTPKDSL